MLKHTKSNSQINSENRKAELWFLQHHQDLVEDKNTISEETLTADLNMAYDDAYVNTD